MYSLVAASDYGGLVRRGFFPTLLSRHELQDLSLGASVPLHIAVPKLTSMMTWVASIALCVPPVLPPRTPLTGSKVKRTSTVLDKFGERKPHIALPNTQSNVHPPPRGHGLPVNDRTQAAVLLLLLLLQPLLLLAT